MKQGILDTDILSYYLKGHTNVVAQVESYVLLYGQIEFSIITYYEIKRGLLNSGASRKLTDFENMAQLSQVWELDKASASEAARICAELWKLGVPLDEADILIAGTACANQRVLITNNTKHFNRIAGLEVVNWMNED
ncbi:MAG: type II toxin-antitoxin system VapC family toxin [Fimbriimonadia bacterium]|nr:type II toxin-antitoxin system VapC family toxin [Fimbriimonadia bacterium]